MSQHDKVNVKKLIKKDFGAFGRIHEFLFQSPLVLVRERNDLLNIIAFDLGTAGFTCDIAIQPVFIPNESIVLSFGNRINHFAAVYPERWAYGEADVCRKGIEQLRSLVQEHSLPWFDQLNDTTRMVSYLESGNEMNTRLTPWQKHLYLGFCYLRLGRCMEAVSAFDEVRSYFDTRNMTWDWVQRWKHLIEEVTKLASSAPKLVEQKLEDYGRFTRSQLGLNN
jgi:hypothetical protein